VESVEGFRSHWRSLAPARIELEALDTSMQWLLRERDKTSRFKLSGCFQRRGKGWLVQRTHSPGSFVGEISNKPC
jgi:hypothetical protein